MIKLSIILPCYNVSPFLEKCFDSIYNQNVDYSFEVIAVDDASTDNTFEILTLLSNKYNNVVLVHHKTNKKLSGARTSGIKIAKGEYILHLDPDDYLLPDSLQLIFKKRPCDWDILFFNILCESENNQKFNLYTSNKVQIYDLTKKYNQKLLFGIIKGSCVAKVIKRSLCLNLCYFDFEYNIGEDFAFNFEIFNRAMTVIYDPHLFYSYRYNSSSLIHGNFNKDRLNYEQSWIKNIISIKNNQSIYSSSDKYVNMSIERYSIGLLLQIRKIPKFKRKNILLLWKRFFESQVDLFGSVKSKWYRFLLRLNISEIYIPLFLLSLGQLEPYKERLKRILHI